MKREAVLEAAAAAFVADGYAGTRMETVAREADVSTATLYGYFKSKPALFAAVIETEARRFAAPASGGLEAVACGYARLLADKRVRGIIRLVIAESPRFPELSALLFDHGKAQVYSAFAAAFEREAQAGRLARQSDWAHETGQITGMITQPILMTWLFTGREPEREPEAVAKAAVARFLTK